MRTNLGQFGGDIGQAVLKSKLSIVPQGPRDDGDEGNEVEGHESDEEGNAGGRGGQGCRQRACRRVMTRRLGQAGAS